MKRTLIIWSSILIPSVILAVYIGQSLTSDTAALAMGSIIGLMGAALAALITAIVRDDRARRDRDQAMRPTRRVPSPEPVEGWIDAEYRELPPRPQAPASRPHQPAIEAPNDRALTIR